MFKSKYLGLAFLLLLTFPVVSHADTPNKNYTVSADIGDNTAQIVNKVIDKSSLALGQISAKLESAAPKAWALVVQGTRATAEATLAIGIASLVWSLLSWGFCFYHTKRANSENPDECYHFGTAMVFGISGGCASISTFVHLFDSDVWAAYLSPEGFLALQMVHQALGH